MKSSNVRRHLRNSERTGWRDKRISERHRLWGNDIYFTDVDFCGIEYYSRKGILLIDYKEWCKRDGLILQSPSHQSLSWLADGRGIPAAVVLYNFDVRPRTFEVIPLNDSARRYFGQRQIMTEEEWVSHQYHLRGLAQDDYFQYIINRLKNDTNTNT